MGFTLYIPSQVLRPFVRSFAISTSAHAGDYRVLPGVSIVMGFQYAGHLSYTHHDVKIPLSHAGITGLCDTFRVFSNSDNIATLLVMFSETGAAAFFDQPMQEIFNLSLALDDLVLRSCLDVLSEQLFEAKSDIERINIIELFLIKRLVNKKHDVLISAAVQLIMQHAGNIRISFLAQHLHISQGRLEKRFRKIVGATPKKFASIVRLRSILDTKAPAKLTHLALDSGYFDQAHFIKDFRSFTGQSPEQYFLQK